MPFSYAQGSIASVSLDFEGDHVKCVILDPARLQGRRYVNQRTAASGAVFTQGFDTNGAGAKFGVQLENVPVSTLRDIIDAINSAVDGQSPFSVDLRDDFNQVTADCTIDGSDWLSWPGARTNEKFVANVTMRFISV